MQENLQTLQNLVSYIARDTANDREKTIGAQIPNNERFLMDVLVLESILMRFALKWKKEVGKSMEGWFVRHPKDRLFVASSGFIYCSFLFVLCSRTTFLAQTQNSSVGSNQTDQGKMVRNHDISPYFC